jgi:hypothetical protein
MVVRHPCATCVRAQVRDWSIQLLRKTSEHEKKLSMAMSDLV